VNPRRLLHLLYDGAAYLAAAFVFAIFAVMIGGTVLRELGMRTGGTDDIVAWFCAAAGFLAMAHTFRHGDFVRVVLLLDRLGERRARQFEILALVIGSLFVAFLAWAAVLFVYESWEFGDMANGLVPIPLWIPQSSFVFGTLLLLAAIVEELILVLRGHRPSYVVAVEERHARGDFSEDI
jgi:TRAP-type C4-dicarboxylate transport system permease small subunit